MKDVKITTYSTISFILALLLFGCSKTEQTRSGILKVQIDHTIDGKPLVWDSLIYKNQAGNVYSVERLQYYVSDIRFYGNKQLITHADTSIFIDARSADKCVFSIINFPFRYVDSISFLIGVTPKSNIPGGLAPTMENALMDWPTMMGGGYHFLKLEGRWLENAQPYGFAMHLGKQGFQVSASSRCAYLLNENSSNALLMTMNVNEWFRDPHTYDFSWDGVYTMGNDPLMQILMENGKDVFNKR